MVPGTLNTISVKATLDATSPEKRLEGEVPFPGGSRVSSMYRYLFFEAAKQTDWTSRENAKEEIGHANAIFVLLPKRARYLLAN
jgi:hypothetical protein